MVKNWLVILRILGKVFLLILVIAACNTSSSGPDTRPKRKFIDPKYVQPQTVESTWRFATIFSPHKFQIAGQDWLALDSMGRPALAYGGSQLNYAWFDGNAWQVETIDSRPGTGKYTHLLFDANDQPHIFYATGGFEGLSLDTAYRDSQGWHHQTIDTDLYSLHLDVILDNQGNPVVAYEAEPRDNDPNPYIDQTQVRVACQVEGKWKTTIASEQASYPSLVFDREMRLHLGYMQHVGRNALVDAIYQPDGTWQEQSKTDVGDFPRVSDLLIDTDLRPHFFYSLYEYSEGGAYVLYHTWLAENGWQKEQVGPIGMSSSIVMDSVGRIYLLGGEKRLQLLRRDADGWQELRTWDDENEYYPETSLVLDRDEQVHAAYFKMPDYTIHYVSEQNGIWQNQIVDQGNEPDWSASNLTSPFAMSYDQYGQLHIAYYDAQHNVHYQSKSSSGWHDEVVAQIQYSSPERIDLVFDLDGQPHIFYENHGLKYAFQANGMWVSEDVPFDPNDEGYVRSPVAINLEGQPAFLEAQYTASELRYRTPDGWSVRLLENIDAGDLSPQIAFPQGKVFTPTGPNESLPDMFYFDLKENALIYRASGQEQHLVVPILLQSDQPRRIAMRQTSSDSRVFLVVIEEGEKTGFRYAIYQNGAWQIYELSDLDDPVISDRLIGLDGSVHLAYLDYMSLELYYVEGNGSAWKKTLITGYTATPLEMILEGTALNQNGEFCILLTDIRANSLILGCLKSME